MSKLFLVAAERGGRTVTERVEFSAPLKIAMPFYREKYTEIMLMAASAGLLEGDFYDIDITVRSGAFLKFTAQSYQKIFRADKVGAAQRVKITVEEGGSFLYEPLPTIPFAGSIFHSDTEVNLSEGSRFAMSDILTVGRAGSGERLKFIEYRSRTLIKLDGRAVFLDNQRLCPRESDLSGIGFFEGYTHSGYLYSYGFPIKEPPEIDGEAAVTKAFRGECVRAVGNGAEEIRRAFSVEI